MDMWKEVAGNDGRPVASVKIFGHEALQHPLVVVVVAGESFHEVFKTYFHSQGQLGVLQTNKVTWRRSIYKKQQASFIILVTNL